MAFPTDWSSFWTIRFSAGDTISVLHAEMDCLKNAGCFELMEEFMADNPNLCNEDSGV